MGIVEGILLFHTGFEVSAEKAVCLIVSVLSELSHCGVVDTARASFFKSD